MVTCEDLQQIPNDFTLDVKFRKITAKFVILKKFSFSVGHLIGSPSLVSPSSHSSSSFSSHGLSFVIYCIMPNFLCNVCELFC
jgi:hypothetical protein